MGKSESLTAGKPRGKPAGPLSVQVTGKFFMEIRGAFFWDYSGIGLPGIDGIHVLLGAFPFSEWTEYHSVYSAPDSRMNRMNAIRFTRNIQNTAFFWEIFGGNSNAGAHAGRLAASGWKTK